MVKKNPLLNNRNREIKPKHYACNLTLQQAIKEIYPDPSPFKYPHGQAGDILKNGSFVSFNGRVGTVIYAYCDFRDNINVPLSDTNFKDLLKLEKLKLME
jgi:hypothetical protein